MVCLRFVLALTFAVVWSGCVTPSPPAERASEAARELNVSSRFGEVTGVLELTAPAMRDRFQVRRAEWGNQVRVVDVELAALTLSDAKHAAVTVDFSWTRVDEGTLRKTRVLQNWEAVDGPWLLVRERRMGGDLGLFGEPVARLETAPRPDVQFPTKVIP